jgi:hypothetical protein
MYFMHRIDKNEKYINLLSCLRNIKCDFYLMLINDLKRSSINNNYTNEEKRTNKQKEKRDKNLLTEFTNRWLRLWALFQVENLFIAL